MSIRPSDNHGETEAELGTLKPPPPQTPLQACFREGPAWLCAEGSAGLAVAGGLARPGFLPWLHCTVAA